MKKLAVDYIPCAPVVFDNKHFKSMKENTFGQSDRSTLLRVPWKTQISLLVLAAPLFRVVWWRPALRHLNTQVLIQPKMMAFVLLSRLGRNADPEFVWHLFNLLRCIPDEIFKDKWVTLALHPLENVPGETVPNQIACCERVLLNSFGLWTAVGQSAKAGINQGRC